MAAKKVLRVRVGTRLSAELRSRLQKYCKMSGISERTIIEDAVRMFLDGKNDTELVLRRFELVDCALKRQRHDIELLSEAFGRYMRLWFAAHVPSTAEAGKAAGRSAAEADYTRFAQHVCKRPPISEDS